MMRTLKLITLGIVMTLALGCCPWCKKAVGQERGVILDATGVTVLETAIQKAYALGGPREVAKGILRGLGVNVPEFPDTTTITAATQSMVAQLVAGLENLRAEKEVEAVVDELVRRGAKGTRETIKASAETLGILPKIAVDVSR